MALVSNDRLNGWKEIGAYFGKDERTVKRWEDQRGLPVHRVPGGAATVFAYPDELDAWLKSVEGRMGDAPATAPATAGEAIPVEASVPPEAVAKRPSPAVRWAALAGLVILVGAAFAVIRLETPAPATASVTTPAVQVAAKKRHVPEQRVVDIYLQGVYYWQRRTSEDLNRAVHLFNQAIAEDPSYAEAFVGLANCYNLLREYSTMPAEEAYPKAKAAAERAIALDDTLAEAHTSLAFGEFFWFWNSAKARASFQRALDLDPESVQTRHWFATSLMYMGEYDRALEEISKAQALDPASRSILADKGLILFYAGKMDESLALLKQLASAEPDFLSPFAYLMNIYLAEGRYDDHLLMARQVATLLKDDAELAFVEEKQAAYRSGGKDAMMTLAAATQQKRYDAGKTDAYWAARSYADAGEIDKALVLLRTSVDRHEAAALILRMDPAFAGLRDKPEFRKMVTDVGLPPLT